LQRGRLSLLGVGWGTCLAHIVDEVGTEREMVKWSTMLMICSDLT